MSELEAYEAPPTTHFLSAERGGPALCGEPRVAGMRFSQEWRYVNCEACRKVGGTGVEPVSAARPEEE